MASEALELTKTTDQAGVLSLGQAQLFSPEIERSVLAEEKQGRYTAERLRTQRPDAYAACIYYLGMNKGLASIGRLLGVHHQTVRAVRDAEPERIDIARSKVVQNLGTAIDLQLERLIESPEAVPMNVAGLVVSQLITQKELLDGRATARVESTERVDVYSDWPKVLAALMNPNERVLEAGNVREIGEPAGIGLAGENVGAIGGGGDGGDGQAGPAIAVGADRGSGAGSDSESLVSRDATLGDATAETASATDRGPETAVPAPDSIEPSASPDAGNGGGGGSLQTQGVADNLIGSEPPKFSGNGSPSRS